MFAVMLRSLFLALLMCTAITAEVKIAQINLTEIEPLLRQLVLSRPENQTIKKQIEDLDREQDVLNGDLAAQVNPKEPVERDNPFAGPNAEQMKKITNLYSEKSRLEDSLKQQIRAELIKVVRLIAADRYAFVLNSERLSDTMIIKSGELVDITLDVRDHLLLSK